MTETSGQSEAAAVEKAAQTASPMLTVAFHEDELTGISKIATCAIGIPVQIPTGRKGRLTLNMNVPENADARIPARGAVYIRGSAGTLHKFKYKHVPYVRSAARDGAVDGKSDGKSDPNHAKLVDGAPPVGTSLYPGDVLVERAFMSNIESDYKLGSSDGNRPSDQTKSVEEGAIDKKDDSSLPAPRHISGGSASVSSGIESFKDLIAKEVAKYDELAEEIWLQLNEKNAPYTVQVKLGKMPPVAKYCSSTRGEYYVYAVRKIVVSLPAENPPTAAMPQLSSSLDRAALLAGMSKDQAAVIEI